MSSTDRRAQLLDVAIDLFSRKGFGGTTTKEIAAAAGVTEAIIYRHFATKQDLYKAILDSRCNGAEADSWLSETKQFTDANDDEGLFRNLIAKIIQAKRDDPRFTRLLLHAALEGHELALMHHNQFALPIGHQIIQYIEKRQSEGAIRALDPKSVIFAVAGIADFYASQKYLYQKWADISTTDDAVAETLLSILMNGIRPTDKESTK